MNDDYIWEIGEGFDAEMLGLIPDFIDDKDDRPIAEQFNERYAHGGGWNPMKGWTLTTAKQLQYPGDEPLEPVARMRARGESVYVYLDAWVVIEQADGSFEVSRMD